MNNIRSTTVGLLGPKCLLLLFLSSNCFFNELLVDAIQCFSCKATASNEIEANVLCLETANVEDCDDFYQYYTQVESQSGDTHHSPPDDFDYYDAGFSNALEKPASHGGTGKRRRNRRSSSTNDDGREGGVGAGGKGTNGNVDYGAGTGGDEYDVANSNGKISGSSNETEKQKLPTDPEHHCYSATKRNSWENYVVEKGCKKIIYCKSQEATNSEWTLPWNFCCDKSRCNAKLVRDKPQRIFGMGCRRTDDCIQGHNTRHVCPDMFQSCPKVSTSVIKMECRARNHPIISTFSSSKGGSLGHHNFFHQSKEKKCFCSRGYFPKGPICTSSGLTFRQNIASLLCIVLAYQGLI